MNRINCISDHLLAPAGKPPVDRTPKDVEIIGVAQAVMKSQIMTNQIERVRNLNLNTTKSVHSET